MFSKSILAIALSPLFARAIITPTSPDSSTVVKVGDTIKALWTVDSVDHWNNVQIQLMTGSNLAMVPLATVASGVDGTTASSYSFKAPDVSPYSKIYFLQFTNGGSMSNTTWTTRFTIASSDGSTTEPEHSDVSNGQTIQWGTGSLLSSVDTNSTSSSNSSSSSSLTKTGAVSTASVSSDISSTHATSSESGSMSDVKTPSTESKTTSNTTSSAKANSSSPSGAGRLEIGLFTLLTVVAVAAII
ncbi:hypothetical protein L204_104735 [Cryptococcus depauperatus]|nr:hypothetical protein L204_03608 [Cryptococcus depauperatus CBS 7855]